MGGGTGPAPEIARPADLTGPRGSRAIILTSFAVLFARGLQVILADPQQLRRLAFEGSGALGDNFQP